MILIFWNFIEIISVCFSVILPLLLVIAFFTLLERKVMASLQRRIGPNIHGYYGALQPLIDGLKLMWKEMLVPAKANFYIFIISPMFMMSLSFSLWAILPLSFSFTLFDSKLSLITFFVISSLNIYNIILAGWSSNSKYAFLGSVRAMGQMFSYELVLGFALLFMLLTVGSLRIYDIVIKQYYVGYLFWPLLPFAIIFFISLLMETNRAPFDLAESESELVAGYNVEYSSIMFAMFFLGEYCNILAMSSIWSLLFWGGFLANYFGVGILIMKILTLCFLFVFIRSLLPRYRIDQLIYVGWHVMLPVAFGLCVFIAFIASFFNIFPQNSAVYLTSTIPENSDISTLFKDLKHDVFKLDKQRAAESLHSRVIQEIIAEQTQELSGMVNKSLYLTATSEHLKDLDFALHISLRQFMQEEGHPSLHDERQKIIDALLDYRWKFNVTRYFSDWLTTEVGRLPYGWTEKNYVGFTTGNDPLSFYKVPTSDGAFRILSEIHKYRGITLKDAEELFVSGQIQLPHTIKDNRFIIAPSKYALLSEAAKAKLDISTPILYPSHIDSKQNVESLRYWITQGIIDQQSSSSIGSKSSYDLYLNATIKRLSTLDFAAYVAGMQINNPDSEVVKELFFIRWRFNMARYFADWLITEVGKVPYGWSERNYLDFISGKDPFTFYKVNGAVTGASYDTSDLHGGLPIRLQDMENFFISNRISLSEALIKNRDLVASSKYALLSNEAKTKLDSYWSLRYTVDGVGVSKDEGMHNWIINKIFKDQISSWMNKDEEYRWFCDATITNPSTFKFATHLATKYLEDPSSNEVISLTTMRWKYNMARYFADWLTTEVGKVPYGWSERNYLDFISGKDPFTFYKVNGPITGAPYDTSKLHKFPITLQSMEQFFISGRISLPQALIDNKHFIEPSKYALLSKEAKAKLDFIPSIRPVIKDENPLKWIGQYSNVLDKIYMEEQPKHLHFKDPIATGVFPSGESEFVTTYEDAEKIIYELENTKLQNYRQKFGLYVDYFFSPELMKSNPEVCNSILDDLISSVSKRPIEEKSDVCSLYTSTKDLDEFPFWDNHEEREELERKFGNSFEF